VRACVRACVREIIKFTSLYTYTHAPKPKYSVFIILKLDD